MGEKCEACGGDVINDVCQQCGTSYVVTKLSSRVAMLEKAIEGWRTECATLTRERDEARMMVDQRTEEQRKANARATYGEYNKVCVLCRFWKKMSETSKLRVCGITGDVTPSTGHCEEWRYTT